MTTTDAPRYTPQWLELREVADAAARAPELLEPLRKRFEETEAGELVIRDLGCGTGSMCRWLAHRLGGPQHWILHDHDADLLERAAGHHPRTAADGSCVSVTTEHGDIGGGGRVARSARLRCPPGQRRVRVAGVWPVASLLSISARTGKEQEQEQEPRAGKRAR